MREIVLDTETTGFDYAGSDRIVEIGCVELFNHMPTGKTYHQYINPLRDVPESAAKIHGLTTEFLASYPVFEEVIQEFREFIADDPLVIHNAEFDMNFLNAEFKRAKFASMPMDRAIDTLTMARKKFPGSPANLDALCRRFQVDNTNRTLHGALLDSELLAEVYLELLGGRQQGLAMFEAKKSEDDQSKAKNSQEQVERIFREARIFAISEAESQAHEAFLEKLSDPLWKKTGS